MEEKIQREAEREQGGVSREKAARIRTVVLILSILAGIGIGLLLSRGKAPKQTKTSFDADGLGLTLSAGFVETGDRQGYDRAYRSNHESVYVRREALTAGLEELSPEEYAARAAAAAAEPAPVPERRDRLLFFSYAGLEDGKTRDCMDFVFRGSEAFWTVHFVCESGSLEKNREAFLQYAAEIRIP